MGAKQKGASGEREAARWLFENLALDELPKRNLEQVRSGGTDLHVYPFYVEVKRQERLSKLDWWLQVSVAAKKSGESPTPVVMYRQNRQPWRFLISARHVGVDRGYIELEENTFKKWANNILDDLQEKVA